MQQIVLVSFLALLVNTLTSEAAKVTGFSCQSCRSPKFQGRDLYLPFCAEDAEGKKETHSNICGAICIKEEGGKFTKGSCDQCEKKCSPIFVPVCNEDQTFLYPNECHAKCAGVTDFKDCAGLNFVIPGKTKLPPNRVPEKQLQKAETEEDQIKEDEDVV